MSTVTDAFASLDFYLEDAKQLVGAWAVEETDARRRVKAVLGERKELTFPAALYVTAVESGYPSWTAFRRELETRRVEPPVARIGLQGVDVYEESIRQLAEAVGKGNEGAIRRVRYQLPRLAIRSDRDLVEQGLSRSDAAHVFAREWGYRSWPAMVVHMRACTVTWHADRVATGDLAVALKAVGTSDVNGLSVLLRRNPGLVTERVRGGTLLDLIAQPDGVGDNLGAELGIDRNVVELLIKAGSPTDQTLVFAACFNRVELVKILLEADAPIRDGVSDWDINALESGVMHGSAESVDAIVESRGLVPNAFWLAAGAGRLESVEDWFKRGGELLPEAGWHRPDFTNIGLEPGTPPADDPKELLAEAFISAARNGRTNVAEFLLKRGVDVNAAPYRGITPLHHAIWTGQLEMVRFLVERGADLNATDEMHESTPPDWAKALEDLHPMSPAILEVLSR